MQSMAQSERRSCRLARRLRPVAKARGLGAVLPLAFCSALMLGSVTGLQGQAGGKGMQPAVWTGLSYSVLDFGETDLATPGIGLRVGVGLPFLTVSALGEYWKEVGDFSLGSAHLEAAYFLARGAHVSPFLLLGLGHARTWYRGDYPERAVESNGPSAALGLGLKGSIWRDYGVRLEAVMRTDDGGMNATLRVLGGYAPTPAVADSQAVESGLDFFASWMHPLSGPWEFVEPGFGLRHSRQVTDRIAATIAFSVVHWQIPGEAFMRSYIWDTRAFIAQPGVQWSPLDRIPVSLRLGPQVVIMGEGPDNGATLGAFVDVAVVRPFGIPIHLGTGWFWFPRQYHPDPRISDDQNGITVSGGISF